MPNKQRLSNGVELGVWGIPSSNSLPEIKFSNMEKLIEILKKDKASVEFFNKSKNIKNQVIPSYILFEIND